MFEVISYGGAMGTIVHAVLGTRRAAQDLANDLQRRECRHLDPMDRIYYSVQKKR